MRARSAWSLFTAGALVVTAAPVGVVGDPPTRTDGFNGPMADTSPVKARLLAERRALAAGRTNDIAVVLDLEPGWHVYWPGVTETGMQVIAEFKGPAGAAFGPPQWPAPVRHTEGDTIVNSVVEKQLVLIVPVDIPAHIPASDDAEITARIDWFVCKDSCITGGADLTLRIPIAGAATGSELPASSDAPVFREARARQPKPLPKSGVASTWEADRLVITARGATRLTYHALQGSRGVADPLENGTAAGDTLRINFRAAGANEVVRGVLTVERAEGKPAEHYWFTTPNPGGTSPGDQETRTGPAAPK